MYKFFLALILLSVPVSTSAVAHSGTEQEEKACALDVQRFCRKLMDQGDFTILALAIWKSGGQDLAGKRPPPLFMNVRPFVGPLGFGKADLTAACGAKRKFAKKLESSLRQKKKYCGRRASFSVTSCA